MANFRTTDLLPTGDSGCAMDPAFIMRKPWIQNSFHGCERRVWDVIVGVHPAFNTLFNASFFTCLRIDIGVIVSRRRVQVKFSFTTYYPLVL